MWEGVRESAEEGKSKATLHIMIQNTLLAHKIYVVGHIDHVALKIYGL